MFHRVSSKLCQETETRNLTTKWRLGAVSFHHVHNNVDRQMLDYKGLFGKAPPQLWILRRVLPNVLCRSCFSTKNREAGAVLEEQKNRGSSKTSVATPE